MATIEATEEAILNSLYVTETIIGREGHKIEALPIKKLKDLIQN